MMDMDKRTAGHTRCQWGPCCVQRDRTAQELSVQRVPAAPSSGPILRRVVFLPITKEEFAWLILELRMR